MVSATLGTLTKGKCTACSKKAFVLYLRLSNPGRLWMLCTECLEATIKAVVRGRQR